VEITVNWNFHLWYASRKHARVILPKLAPTSRKRLCKLPLVWEKPTFLLPMDELMNLRGERTLFTELYRNSRSVDPATIEDRKITKTLQEIKCYDLCDIYVKPMGWLVF
jgi:hypothetical protein